MCTTGRSTSLTKNKIGREGVGDFVVEMICDYFLCTIWAWVNPGVVLMPKGRSEIGQDWRPALM